MRLFLIIGSIWWIVFSIVIGNVFVDGVVFNSSFIIINGIYSIILILRYRKVHLNPLEEKIYHADFKNVMDRRTFRDFIRKAYLRSYSEGGQVVHHGNNFASLYYVALLNPNYAVSYIKKTKEYFQIKEHTWIGIVEYVMYQKELKLAAEERIKDKKTGSNKSTQNAQNIRKFSKTKMKWGLDAVVKFLNTDKVPEQEIFQEYDDACYVYEISLRDLDALFADKDYGSVYRNSLYSIWLAFTTKAVVNVDNKLVSEKNMANERKKKNRKNEEVCLDSRNLQDGLNTNKGNNDIELKDIIIDEDKNEDH